MTVNLLNSMILFLKHPADILFNLQLASVMVSGAGCTCKYRKHHQVSQLACQIPAASLVLFFRQCKHATSMPSFKFKGWSLCRQSCYLSLTVTKLRLDTESWWEQCQWILIWLWALKKAGSHNTLWIIIATTHSEQCKGTETVIVMVKLTLSLSTDNN